MPKRSTKHVPKHQQKVGAVKNGKLKVKDETTGRESWRKGTKGFSKDWDGDPIAINYNREGLKRRPKHSPHMGDRKKAYHNDE